MEESVTLQYGNFAILGEQVKEFTQRTSCSNRVADQTLSGQLFLNELRQEHLSWSTTHKQEWGLFLLECLLHNAASMRRKGCQMHAQALQVDTAELTALEHHSIWTFLGSTDMEILKVTEQVYWGECTVVPSVLPH